eukprot:TRINITY_DN2810_c0_g1_i2.p1 TRINITY_DN2810_c0_g1~~TRINITY_DN2810_c0_g1_i2.p1  ORF type:complete len:567 (-),score=36.48 TRINITY_DN2810_c0_g1_i2:513-2213(-)
MFVTKTNPPVLKSTNLFKACINHSGAVRSFGACGNRNFHHSVDFRISMYGKQRRNRSVNKVASPPNSDYATKTDEAQPSSTYNSFQSGPVVVVGGGPAGLGTALMLAKQGWKDITVLEALDQEKYYSLDRSYSYQLNRRGYTLLQSLDVFHELQERGMISTDTKGFCMVKPDGKQVSIPSPYSSKDINQISYVLNRLDVSTMLKEKFDDYKDRIKFHFNAKCIDLQTQNDTLAITYQIDNQPPETIEPQLIVGSDGTNSVVRTKLHELSGNQKYNLTQHNVVQTGYRFKIVQLPEGFTLSKENKTKVDPLKVYNIIGALKGKDKNIGLLVFPSGRTLSKRGIRLGILSPRNNKHELFRLDSGEKVLDLFEKQFPQLPIRELISQQDAERFAKSRGGVYPPASYCDSTSYVVRNQQKGVILLGDSLHFHPPDLGQGVNAAFEDVMVFQQLLESNKQGLNRSLEEYEKLRVVDAKALIDIHLYFSNSIFLRLFLLYLFTRWLRNILHGILPVIFPPNQEAYFGNPNMRYSEAFQAIKKADLFYTVFFALCCFGVAFVIIKGVLGMAAL